MGFAWDVSPAIGDPGSIVAVDCNDRGAQPPPADHLMCQELTEKKVAANRADRSRVSRPVRPLGRSLSSRKVIAGCTLRREARMRRGRKEKSFGGPDASPSGFCEQSGVWTAADAAANERNALEWTRQRGQK